MGLLIKADAAVVVGGPMAGRVKEASRGGRDRLFIVPLLLVDVLPVKRESCRRRCRAIRSATALRVRSRTTWPAVAAAALTALQRCPSAFVGARPSV